MERLFHIIASSCPPDSYGGYPFSAIWRTMRPARVMPKMAVMWQREPLTAFLLKLMEGSISEASPLFSKSSGEYTHLNFRRGKVEARLKWRRRAAPSGHPCTFQNSATEIRVGSSFRAAPRELTNTGRRAAVAFRISNAFADRESMASTT